MGIAISIFQFSSRTFRLVSQDGVSGPGLGVSGKGRGMATSGWVSSDGLTVEQVVVGYLSVGDARRDFELERSRAERMIQTVDASRIVGKFGTTYKVITLKGDQITYISSPHLEAALAFERSWWELSW